MLRMGTGLDHLARVPVDGRRSPDDCLSDLVGIRRRVIREEVVIIDQTLTIRLGFFLELFADAVVYHGGRGRTPYLWGHPSRRSLWRAQALGFVLMTGLFFPRLDGLLDMRVAVQIKESRCKTSESLANDNRNDRSAS